MTTTKKQMKPALTKFNDIKYTRPDILEIEKTFLNWYSCSGCDPCDSSMLDWPLLAAPEVMVRGSGEYEMVG